jgi:hypothetical protein
MHSAASFSYPRRAAYNYVFILGHDHKDQFGAQAAALISPTRSDVTAPTLITNRPARQVDVWQREAGALNSTV